MKNNILKVTRLISVFSITIIIAIYSASFKINDNQLLKIDYFGEITIPSEMEIQSGSFKEMVNEYNKIILGNLENHQSLVFQQKGLNSKDPNAFKTYARVVIDTYKGEKGTYKSLSENNNLTNDDIDFYKNNFETQVKTIWPNAKQRLISNSEPTISKIGQFYCTRHNYTRQLEDSPNVFVDVLRYQNNDRVHLISFSYRIKDQAKWEPIMNRILNSIKLTKF